MKSNKLVMLMVFAAILCISMLGSANAAGNNTTGLADSAYPTYQVDNQRTGQSHYNGPQTNTTKWTYSNGDMSMVSVLGSDGTIYVGSVNTTSSSLVALNRDGTVKWNYNGTTTIKPGSLTIGNNETLYVSGTTGLHALNSNTGELLWTYNTTVSSRYITIGSDGTIYLGKTAINPDGTPKWNCTTTYGVLGYAIGSDGTIYLQTGKASSAGILYALNPADGSEKWSINTGYTPYAPAIGADGTIYVVSGSILYAIKPDGTPKWNYTSSQNVYSAPIIATDGTIYLICKGFLCALKDNGTSVTQKWTYTDSNMTQNFPMMLGSDGTIYLASKATISALKDNGTSVTQKWTSTDSNIIGTTSIMIGADGTLYDIILYKGTSLPIAKIIAIQDFVADFAANTGNGLSVNFTDNSSNLPVTWVWDFGDGNSSDLKNPTHVYSSSGTYDVTLLVINGSGDSRTVTKSVKVSQAPTLNPIGDKNVAANETLNFTVSGSDPDGDTLTYSATGLPSGATFDPNTGAFSWTPTASQTGSYVVTFTVSDGVSSVSQDVNIVVGKPNTAPVLNPVEDKIVDEGQSLNFNLNGQDADGDSLTYSATGLPAGATLDPSTGAFSWTPSYSQSGTYHVTFTVSDGKLTDSKTVTITVNNVNRAPTLNPVEDKTVDENQGLNFTVTGSDVDGDNLTYTATGLPDGATFDSSTGSFSWTPSYSQSGTYHVTFTVSDGNLTDSKTVTITVNNVNRAPTIGCVSDKTINENKKLTFSVCGDDLDGDSLTYSTSGLPGGATFNTSTGAFTWIPSYSQAGTYTVTFTVSDGKLTDSKTMKVTVKDVDNVAPTVKGVDPAYKAAVNNAGKVVKVTFSEAVKMGTGWIELQKTNGTKVAVKTATNGKTLYIAANSALANGTYRVLLHGGCVTDLAGNRSGSSVSYFTVDTVAPKVKAVYPRNASVTRNASKVMVVCNETMKMGTGWIELQKTNGTKIAIRTAVSGSTLYIAPTSALSNGTYRVILHGGCLTDQAGNRLAGYLSYFTIKK